MVAWRRWPLVARQRGMASANWWWEGVLVGGGWLWEVEAVLVIGLEGQAREGGSGLVLSSPGKKMVVVVIEGSYRCWGRRRVLAKLG